MDAVRPRQRAVVALAAALVVAVAGCAGRGPSGTAPPPAGAVGAPVGCLNPAGWPIARLARQVVAVPVGESAVEDASPEVAAGAGGVLLFGTSAPRDLGVALKALQSRSPVRPGVLVMSDEEGGGVQRMRNLVGSLPWAKQMSTWSASAITARVETLARRMRANGVDVDLAPVVDVDASYAVPGPSNADGLRSFSGGTSVVATDGLAYARGLSLGGVTAVLKHFPGLGGASANTDYRPARTLPWATEKRVGLPPFQAGIRAGVPAIMVSNATVPGLAVYPSSLSPAVIHDLTVTLGFRGLVVTDSLSAAAVRDAGFDVQGAAVQALRAGADLLLFGASTPTAAQATFADIVNRTVAQVRAGALPRSRVVAAATAVLRARHASLCR